MRSPSTSLTSSLQIFPILKRTRLLTSRYFVQQFVHKGPHCEAIKGLCVRGDGHRALDSQMLDKFDLIDRFISPSLKSYVFTDVTKDSKFGRVSGSVHIAQKVTCHKTAIWIRATGKGKGENEIGVGEKI
ncbi:hypothetical protein CDAR_550781 [Caerostris darwini]|uniref:Uncharacterized protein n=1 Tax=Caerostris darwini TaxID=1538125 RepID=A0AAV4QPR8_9ARAC|nr:hypothetical protein CDAR_550781 [Caerostris darwini]